jgi:hypothetical protein
MKNYCQQMYIQNRRNSSEINSFSPLQNRNGLISLKPAIAYFAYTCPLASKIMKIITYILPIFFLMSCHTSNSWNCDGNCSNGYGIKNWKDGGLEKGYWVNDELVGKGFQFFGKTSKFAGDSYEGDFQNGYHGFGTYISVSMGAIYTGEWQYGNSHGKGKLTFGLNSEFPNRYYDGEWKDHKRHGYGIKFWGEAGAHTNDKYAGEWKNDEMYGYGRYDWSDGSYYKGYWKDGKQDGEGIYTFSDGKEFNGVWNDGYCKELAIILYGEE